MYDFIKYIFLAYSIFIGKDGKTIPFKRGYLSYAGSGEADGRSNQFFVTYKDEETIGALPWEVPFARILSGMDVLESLYPLYEDEVSQTDIVVDGEIYLKRHFPQMSYITKCTSHGRIATVSVGDKDGYQVTSWTEPGDVMLPSIVELSEIPKSEDVTATK